MDLTLQDAAEEFDAAVFTSHDSWLHGDFDDYGNDIEVEFGPCIEVAVLGERALLDVERVTQLRDALNAWLGTR